VHDRITAGLAVAVAFNSGNLPAVAQALRARIFRTNPCTSPATTITRKRASSGPNGQPKPNVGREKAQEAAQCSPAGSRCCRRFRPEDAGSDWNDLAQPARSGRRCVSNCAPASPSARAGR
jgi:phage/plasmid primase-like uncharacterized protein